MRGWWTFWPISPQSSESPQHTRPSRTSRPLSISARRKPSRRRIMSAMLISLLLTGLAAASEIHTGVPVNGIDGLGPPRFQTVDTGWMADVPSGFVRVFVGPTTEDAIRWMNDQRVRLAELKPAPNIELQTALEADEAVGDGKQLVLFRSGNIAVCSRNSVDATRWARAIRTSIIDIPAPWPTPPVLTGSKSEWVIEATEGTHHVAFVGGVPSPKAHLHFTSPPYRLISWDGWGRATWTELESSD